MDEQMKEYAKRLKLSWIPQNYQTIKADTMQEFLLKLFEQEVQQHEERKINLLLKQAVLPRIPDKLFGLLKWKGMSFVYLRRHRKSIFLAHPNIPLEVHSLLVYLEAIEYLSKVAPLVNALFEAGEKGNLGKLMKQIEKLDLLIIDELGYIPLHKQDAVCCFR